MRKKKKEIYKRGSKIGQIFLINSATCGSDFLRGDKKKEKKKEKVMSGEGEGYFFAFKHALNITLNPSIN